MKIFNVHSVTVKIVLVSLLMTVFMVALSVAALFYYQPDQTDDTTILKSQNTAAKLKLRIDRMTGVNGLSPEVINKIIKEASSLGSGNLTLYSDKGNVFVHIVNSQIALKTSASEQELAIVIRTIARQGFESMPFYYETDPQQKTVSVFIPFTYSKDKKGVAEATFAVSATEGPGVYSYLLIGGLVVVFQAVFVLVLFNMVLFPMRRLSRGASRIVEGNYDVRIPIVRNDEIGRLASAVNEMSVALQRMKDEARGTNPLTGLPGHISIFNYLNDCLAEGRVICALYCDLSNFRAYNEKYGFTKGDEVVVYMRDCLRLAAKKNNLTDIFIGHEGGDDFVAITGYEEWEIFAKSVVTFFDKGIHSFYNSTDTRNGYIESVNRRGERRRIPLMSISMAVVTNKTRDFQSVAELISVAGEVRRYVKNREGSCYAIDRRTGRMSTPPTVASGTSADPNQSGWK